MPSMNQPAGGALKGVQRGTIAKVSAGSATATITAVVTGKTHLTNLGFIYNPATAVNAIAVRSDAWFSHVALTNTTTVTFASAGNTSDTNTMTVSFEAVEFF